MLNRASVSATLIVCALTAFSGNAYGVHGPAQYVLAKVHGVHAVGAQEKSQEKSSEKRQEKSQEKSKSLDELLELDEEASNPARNDADAARKDQEAELQRRLTEQQIASNIALAVEKMSISADLLDTKFEPGLGTQRVQEDIIARLELLIQQCSQCQSSGSSSSSRGSSSSSSRDQQAKRNPGQQPNQGASANQQAQNQPGDNRGELEPPPPQEGPITANMEENRSEWGNLPQRVRDMLLQGRREKFSSLYEQLTQEYFKRLAEEGTP